jgi:hypothetical protein
MGYRGEDVPGTHGDWGRQTPWQPSSGASPGSPGAWDGESPGYAGDENYPPADASGVGYGPDSGYAAQGQQGYGAQDGQYPDPYGQQQQPYERQPYEQQPYEQNDGYGPGPGHGPGQGQGGPGGYDGTQGYPQQGEYGYDRAQPPAPGYDQAGYDRAENPSPGYGQAGYDQAGYDQAGYDQRPAPGYAAGGGYQDPGAGYQDPGGYQDPRGGYGQAAGYPASPTGTAGYPAPRGGSGGYPALPSGQGGYSEQDAGNDWYGGQPAAANGASFADTGSYRLNGRVIDEYGTGPREALRDPVRGYPPGPGQPGTGQPGTGPLPTSANPAPAAPQAFTRTGSQDITDTRQQGRYEDRASYPDYGQDEPGARPGRGASDLQGASGGLPGLAGRDGFDSRGGYAAPDPYAAPDAYAAPGYGDYDEAPTAVGGPGGDGYNDYGDGFDGYDADGDPYEDRYGNGTGPRAAGGGRGSGKASGGAAALGPLRGKRLLFAALAVVAVGIIGVAAYVFVLKPSSPATASNAQKALPTGSAAPSQQACAKALGTYCHIDAAVDDPKPLTAAELFPPAFTNEKDKTSYSLVSTKLDKTCGNAVIGSALIKALKTGKCTQVVRGSYVSGDNKIMGTIGVINLSSTNEAHYAGRVVGQNDFIAPLTSAKGVASKLGNGTGVVEAEFKGHYLILTWSEFVNGANPSTKAQDTQLEQFSNDLVSGTANIDLSQRMVTGVPPSPAAKS